MTTLLDLRAPTIRVKSGTPAGLAPPAAIFLTDGWREWGGLFPTARFHLPRVLVLGDCNPGRRTGPPIWVRCVVDDATDLPGVTADGAPPVIRLPGVKSGQLRAGRHAHMTRNPMLVRVLTHAEIMRDEGEGVARVFREIAASLLREPEIESSAGLFRMMLFNQPVTGAMRPGWSHLLGTLPIPDGQRRMLLPRPTGFTARDYSEGQRNQRGRDHQAAAGPLREGHRGAWARRCRIAPQLFRCPSIGDGRPVAGDQDSALTQVLQPQSRAPGLRLPGLGRGRPPQRPARVAPTRGPRGLDGPRNGTRHPLRARYHTRMSKRKLREWNPRGLRGVPAIVRTS